MTSCRCLALHLMMASCFASPLSTDGATSLSDKAAELARSRRFSDWQLTAFLQAWHGMFM